MRKIYRPIPIDREIKLNNKKIIVSKTDRNGKILYANDYFCEVSGYELDELLGVSHNILRHPDMPKAIFYLMWQSIKNGNNITAMVKNLSKSGEYYWVTTDFEHHRNSDGEIDTYLAFRRPASKKAIDAIEDLYSSLLAIEKTHGLDASLIYLQGYLDERHTNYNKLMSEIVSPKSLMEKFFNIMKKTFIHNNNVNYSNNYREAV